MMIIRLARLNLLMVLLCVVAPSLAHAQAEISGIVRDASGAVLPGVTVEAASPALIEKVRAVSTDGTGRYRIIDLRPGSYTVTFTLAGFSTVRREGLELTGAFVANVDAELRVGALAETVTVTGATPTVDVQTVTRQAVMSTEVIDALPTSRNVEGLARLVPGVVGTSRDVGGASGAAPTVSGSLSMHGSRSTDTRITLNGVSVMTLVAGGGVGGSVPDVGSAQEVVVEQTAVSAEFSTGGLRINFIPRDGGNQWSSSTFFTASSGALQGDNYTDRVKKAGLTTPNSIKHNWDFNPALGGPIRRDKVWFWFSARDNVMQNYLPMFYNLNAFDPTKWTYEPDKSRQAYLDAHFRNAQARVTWQATPRNKFAATYKAESWCRCPDLETAGDAGPGITLVSPEASSDHRFPRLRQEHAEWTSPVTNRVLIEVVGMHLFERYGRMHLQPAGSLDPSLVAVLPLMVPVLEQSNGMQYRQRNIFSNELVPSYAYRAAVSYVSGAHAVKVGVNNTHGFRRVTTYEEPPYFYRFRNGVPNQITIRAVPYTALSNEDADFGIYAQERWTLSRFSIGGALRYDYFGASFPEQHLGPGPLVPTRDLTLPAQDNLAWKDITYRTSVAYDLRGNGKTALKVSFNKYLLGQGLNALGSTPNPVNTLVLSTTRSWNDANRDYVPNCNLLAPAANGECGAMANTNFGNAVPGATFDPDLLTGWGHRQFNHEFSVGVQHEVLPRVSADVGYFRRSWGNFPIVDNLALGPNDFDNFSIIAPTHPELPGGGGFTLTGLRDLKPASFGRPAQNYNTLSDKYGKQIEVWNGMDVTVNARLKVLTLQGGISTGKTLEDDCEIAQKLPEANLARPLQFCRRETPYQTQLKAYGVYTVPTIDVQVAATFQSIPGPAIQASYTATNADVAASLGRPLSGGAANTTVNLLQDNSLYGERLNQLDLRFGKIIRVGRTKTNLSLDVYNALNADTVRVLNNSFGAWLQPTEILLARFAKISVQFDF